MNDVRLLHLKHPLLDNTFLLTEFIGEESMNEDFHYICRGFLAPEAVNVLEELVSQRVRVSIDDTHGGIRWFHGIVNDVWSEWRPNSDNLLVELTLGSWFGAWQLCQNNTVFQGQSVIDIFKILCQRHGDTDYRFALSRAIYPKLDYITQQQESDFAFINRLFEQAGIRYYFDYDTTHARHRLILSDDTHNWPAAYTMPLLSATKTAYSQGVPSHNSAANDSKISAHRLSDSQTSQQLQPSHLQARRYDSLYPNRILAGEVATQQHHGLAGTKQLLHQCHPGDFQSSDDAARVMKAQAQALTWQANLETYCSNAYHLSAGKYYVSADEPRIIQRIIHVYHHAWDNSHIQVSDAHQPIEGNVTPPTSSSQGYRNHHDALISHIPYVPVRKTPKPKLAGWQPAQIYQPPGNHQAAYTTLHGHVQVSFAWDNREKSQRGSCWLRVKKPLSGYRWGHQWLPRQGHGVAVIHEGGEGERPLLLGSLYRGDHSTPYGKQEAYRSGWQSRTHTSDASEGKGHAICFNDNEITPSFDWYSQNQFNLTVGHDANHHITANQTTHVNQHHHTTLHQGCSNLQAKHKITYQVGNSQLIIDDSGVHFHADNIELLAPGCGTLMPLARQGDVHTCPKHNGQGRAHTGGPILAGSHSTYADKQPVARLGDPTHCDVEGPSAIAQGTPNITADGKPMAKLSHAISHGGALISGSEVVKLGDPKILSPISV
ncbi:MAG: type VI secretion system tip protein VgrG [Gammaproteobacteria bacterium]|nr:type VI secretion system tip protein VgrG [Gammaproteobacteria bacterium]